MFCLAVQSSRETTRLLEVKQAPGETPDEFPSGQPAPGAVPVAALTPATKRKDPSALLAKCAPAASVPAPVTPVTGND